MFADVHPYRVLFSIPSKLCTLATIQIFIQRCCVYYGKIPPIFRKYFLHIFPFCNQQASHSISQSINQPINQSIKQLINQSIMTRKAYRVCIYGYIM